MLRRDVPRSNNDNAQFVVVKIRAYCIGSCLQSELSAAERLAPFDVTREGRGQFLRPDYARRQLETAT